MHASMKLFMIHLEGIRVGMAYEKQAQFNIFVFNQCHKPLYRFRLFAMTYISSKQLSAIKITLYKNPPKKHTQNQECQGIKYDFLGRPDL